MKYIVMDLEMNPIDRMYKAERAISKNEIIEIGAVVLDEEFNEVSNFMTYVKPMYNEKIERNIEKLTGISTEMVKNAPDFFEAFEMFTSFVNSVKGEYEICEWSDSDHLQLIKEIELKEYILTDNEEFILSKFYDFQDEFDKALGLNNQVSLKNALMYAGIDFEGREHDALFDARNTATLLTVTRVEDKRKVVLDKIIDILHPTELKSSLGSMFDFSSLDLAV